MLHSEPGWYATIGQQWRPWAITRRPIRVLPQWDRLSLHALESRRLFLFDIKLFGPRHIHFLEPDGQNFALIGGVRPRTTNRKDR